MLARYKSHWRALCLAINKGQPFTAAEIAATLETDRSLSPKERSALEREVCQLAFVLQAKGALSEEA